GRRNNSYSPQFVQLSKVAYFLLATCCEEWQRLSDRKQLSSSNLQDIAPEIGNRPGGRCAASCGKTSKIPQAYHRLWNKSCGPSGTPRICARATPQLCRGGCSSVCHRLEPCGTLQEGHANGAGWPVALLADENLGHSLQLWLVGFIDFFTEDKGDKVRVLLD